MNPVIKRNQLEVTQKLKKLPTASITMGKDIKMKVRVLGKLRLENPLKKGKSPVPAKNPK